MGCNYSINKIKPAQGFICNDLKYFNILNMYNYWFSNNLIDFNILKKNAIRYKKITFDEDFENTVSIIILTFKPNKKFFFITTVWESCANSPYNIFSQNCHLTIQDLDIFINKLIQQIYLANKST